MNGLQVLYAKSPYWLQHVFLNAYAFSIHLERYGGPFHRAFDELQKTQWFTKEEIEQYQLNRLQPLVRHAYYTVPFYRDKYDSHEVAPEDIKSLSDLSKLPIITAEDVRSAGKSILSVKYSKKKLIHGHTSGTTGTPLSVCWDKQTCVYNNAVDWRQKAWAGIHYGDRLALILGRTIVAADKKQPPFWQHDRIHNMLWMSAFHLSEEFLPYYYERLWQFKPKAIEGYPSTIFILARYLDRIGKTFPVKAVFVSSETLFPTQRALIEDRFEAPVYDFFGMAERVAFATQCAEAREYHLNFEYAINEVGDSNGNLLEPGKQGYLIGTSLLNYGMPLIRYKTSDITAINTARCTCGRYMPRFTGVTTKDEDIVVTPEGKLISSSILTHPFKPLDSIKESQLIQEKIDLLRVKIVPRENYTEKDSTQLINALKERVGANMRIEIELTDKIPRTNAGKLRWVISKIHLSL